MPTKTTRKPARKARAAKKTATKAKAKTKTTAKTKIKATSAKGRARKTASSPKATKKPKPSKATKKPKPSKATKKPKPSKARTSKGVALTLDALEPKFSEFEYPMWYNTNYFTGAMRVTGFVCDAGQAIVWEHLMTGLGDYGVSREVTVHASFEVEGSWRVHVARVLEEDEIFKWDGKDQISTLTGVRRVAGGTEPKYVVPPEGPRTSARLANIGDVPLSIDMTGLSEPDAALLDESTGPREKLMVRLGQEPFRSKVFPKVTQLANEAALPKDAKALFSFDVFGLPLPGEPASSSPDIVAMVDALATGTKLTSLPSDGGHPLAPLVIRSRALGSWGDARLATG